MRESLGIIHASRFDLYPQSLTQHPNYLLRRSLETSRLCFRFSLPARPIIPTERSGLQFMVVLVATGA